MSKSIYSRSALLVLVLATMAGCSSSKSAIYEHEEFTDSGTFSRNYPVTDGASCEAARRALLSQGYIISSSDPKLVSGHKSFQQTGETHMEISFSVVCAKDSVSGAHSIMFANALQDRYALKKVNSSASVGVGVLGSLSVPIGSTDDSMVKVASETVSSAKFYDRFFALVEAFLPTEVKKAAHISEKPKADLGEPEPVPVQAPVVPAPAPTVAEPTLAKPEPQPLAPVTSGAMVPENLAPAVQAVPIVPVVPALQPVVVPAPAPVEPKPVEPKPEATEAQVPTPGQ